MDVSGCDVLGTTELGSGGIRVKGISVIRTVPVLSHRVLTLATRLG